MAPDGTVVEKNLPFKLTNRNEDVPLLHRVYDVRIKRLSDDLTVPASVRQYIDGEDMGSARFDADGQATLGLNTAGLKPGDHAYKVVYKSLDGVTVERLQRFRVE